MARPHICFIQSQMLPWQAGLGLARPEVSTKMLSHDDVDGSSTQVVRYPAGWARPAAEHLGTHEEFLVLEGAIEIGGQLYDTHSYGFLPAGFVREGARSERGAVLLTMLYGKAETRTGDPAQPFDEQLLVRHVDPLAMDWDPGLVDPQLAKGVAIKHLRTDPYTKETSFLYCSPPHRVPAGMWKPQWTHPMVEELYVLDGEYVWADLGRMKRGGYAWWREDVYHGPSGTDTGYNLFVRTIGGPLVNTFDTVKKPHTWNPEHRPALPDELKPYGQPLAMPPRY
mgnify:CR=1 FL=1